MMEFHSLRRTWKGTAFLASLGLSLLLGPLEAQDLYWTVDGAAIQGADADGSNVQTVFDGTGMYGSAVDVVATASHIYWTDKTENGGAIWRANRDGSGAEKLVDQDPMFRSPQFIALDEANDRLYFSCYYNGVFSAKLSDGTDLTDLGQPSSNHTGVALRTSNELLSVNGTSGDGTIYRTDIAARTHAWWKWIGGNGQNYGFVLDTDTDIAYVTDLGDGALRSFNINDGTVTELLTGLNQPLGLTLSPSKTHLVFVERGNNTISAYEIASGESFEITSGDAHFGVAIAVDPTEPSAQLPTSPADLPIADDFSNGTPGESIADQPTSDGKAIWREIFVGADASIHYGDVGGDVGYEPRADVGQATVFLDSDADQAETFVIRIGELLLRGDDYNASLPVFIGARKTSDSLDHGYQFRPWRSDPHFSPDGTVRKWAIRYQGEEHHTLDDLAASGDELALEDLELRVRGNMQRLYWGDGKPADPVWRATEAMPKDGAAERIFMIGVEGGGDAARWLHPRFDDIVIEELPVEATFTEYFNDYGDQRRNLAELRDESGNILPDTGLGSSGDEWSGPWTDNTHPDYHPATGLTYEATGYDNSGNLQGATHGAAGRGTSSAGQMARRAFAHDLGGTVWISALVEYEAETGGDMLFWLNRQTEVNSFFAIRGNEGVLRYPTLGDLKAGSFQPGTTHLLLARVDLDVNAEGHDVVSFWINPDLSGGEAGLGNPLLTGSGVDVFGRSIDNIGVSFSQDGDRMDAIRISNRADGFDQVTSSGASAGGGFADWQDIHFGADAGDASIAGPEADPDGDSISNLLEYALGGDPLVPGTDILPSEEVATVDGEDRLTLTFTRPVDRTDIRYEVDASADLVEWVAAQVDVQVFDNGDGTETVVYRDSQPVATTDRRFLRLRVSQQ